MSCASTADTSDEAHFSQNPSAHSQAAEAAFRYAFISLGSPAFIHIHSIYPTLFTLSDPHTHSPGGVLVSPGSMLHVTKGKMGTNHHTLLLSLVLFSTGRGKLPVKACGLSTDSGSILLLHSLATAASMHIIELLWLFSVSPFYGLLPVESTGKKCYLWCAVSSCHVQHVRW